MIRKLTKITLAGLILVGLLAVSYPLFLKSWLVSTRDSLLWPIYNTDAGHSFLIQLKDWGLYDQYKRTQKTRGAYVLEHYQMMKDIHDVFELTNIKYWADGGTLLGALRHGGMIPWDDDLDIQIHQKDAEKFRKNAIPLLKRLGYGLQGSKIISSQEKFKSLPSEYPPSCDVFIATEKNGRLDISWEHGIAIKDHLPLKLVKFGNMEIWINNNPEPYLIALYGENWSQQAMRGYDHLAKESRQSSAIPFALDKNRMQPARPLGPLKDNRELIERELKNLH